MAAPKIPTTQEVTAFHKKADTDGSRTSIHHTLGGQKEQAAPGNHDHRGGDSVLLLDGTTISGAKTVASGPLTWDMLKNGFTVAVVPALQSIIAAEVALGAKDSTT